MTALVATIRELWSGATHREERYAATTLLDVPAVRPLRRPEQMVLLRELIMDGAWWDHSDELARRAGELLRLSPSTVGPVLTAWQSADDLWLRRVSIICRLGAKGAIDLDRLAAAVEASADRPEFFLRKAIGWALRDYARIDPEWVRAFVATHDLSPLSRREALKHLN